MKLLKIGSAANCNIVFNSEYVSGIHAEMTLYDDGKIVLEDKNSLNGTYVGSKRLTPNEEVRIQRGDLVRFGDVELNWNRVPVNYGPKNGELWYNIGSSQKVEIPVSSPFVGRYHAILMIKDKKAFIMDNESKNGTLVDGKKIITGKFQPLKKGQSVIVGDTDITEQLQAYIPSKMPSWLKPALIALACIAVLAGIGLLIANWGKLIDGGEKEGKTPTGETWSKGYVPAVVYVQASYHYVIVFEDNPISKDIWEGEMPFPQTESTMGATAFFLDRRGVMATNRHVALPWEYEDDAVKTELLNLARQYRDSQIRVERCRNSADVALLQSTELGMYIFKQCAVSLSPTYANLNSMIKTMKQAKISLKGVMDYISVAYPDRNYTHLDELERCFPLGVSDTRDKDVALLQLNTKHTPDNIQYVFDLATKTYDGPLDPLAEKLVMIGYPKGMAHAFLKESHSMQPVVREVMVGMKPDRYSFEYQGESLGGASGSPIFNPKNGMLYGINWGRWTAGATFGQACKAPYVKELYEEYQDVI